ncbi:MAG: DUF4242 domain-containing protein, partial [Desulforhopalus sp.]|nr:DUF4242 domain-containing protein [Desulforhopalus sp.]
EYRSMCISGFSYFQGASVHSSVCALKPTTKLYCIYIAPDEKTVREHAAKGEFPANSVCEVKGIIDPTTAE